METNVTHRTKAQDQKTQEWRVGLRIGLKLAEEISETVWRNGRIDVLDESGKVVFSALYRDLAMLEWKVLRCVGGRSPRQSASPRRSSTGWRRSAAPGS